ncbi:acetylxylan esterase [Streptomyces profundus]|uniref:acetylxylan esterase n=1 Tax=Streptomyces profundus TaxID=2867410 RepID=UPI001D169443|nr:acetylxylan esterase [Streptomyces sp. MA3_2.13]UED86279.1 acetylxylan esterase [Streptomyces sp. MA3_2.13]
METAEFAEANVRVRRLRYAGPFDPTYGYDPEGLLAVGAPPAPGDFADFWRLRFARAAEVQVRPRIGPLVQRDAAHRTHRVDFGSVGGRRIGGWLTLPASGPVTRGCVATHGYGGRERPDPTLPPPGAATVWPVLRGLGALSRFPDIPEAAEEHVLHGIASRDTYVHGDCAADVWCAATALLELVPEAAAQLTYLGTSFGGGIGPLALPWDERFSAAALTVPSFGNHPLRLTLPCAGSGEAVRRLHRVRPGVADVLRYFDAATAASHLRVPTHVGAALLDPVVPPPGQFAIHNALAGPRRLFVLTAGHFDHPDAAREQAALLRSTHRFLAETPDERRPDR